jgi:hypothetical protein
MTGKEKTEEKKIYQKPKRFFEKSGFANFQESYYNLIPGSLEYPRGN